MKITRAKESDATDTDVLTAVTKMLEARIPVMGEEGLRKLERECSEAGRNRLATHPQYERGTTSGGPGTPGTCRR